MTLTGVGGVGKTRLAVRAAWEMRRAFPDGVCLVELAGLEDDCLVAQAVVTSLGLQDQSTRWTADTLAQRLAAQRMLLVLDNCEHLLDACSTHHDTGKQLGPYKGVSSRRLRREFPEHIRKYLWGSHFWSPSYFAGACGGAPLEIVKEYITPQPETPQLKR